MYPKVSTHRASSEAPVLEEQEPAQELVPALPQRVLARVLPEPAQEPALPQQEEPELAQEPEQQEPSVLELEPAALVLELPLLPPERGRRLGSQVLPAQPESPGWLAALQAENKTQPAECQGP